MTSVSQPDDPAPVPVSRAVADLIELSDLLDVHLGLRLDAWREGYAAGELAHVDDYERGFLDGVMALKRAQHEVAELVEFEAGRWTLRGEKRTRQTFSHPHPNDYPGGAAA